MFDTKNFLGLTGFEWSCWGVGVLFWAWFLFAGEVNYLADDWPLTYQRFAVIKMGLEEGRWPFYASLFPQELVSGIFYYVQEGRFLADVNLMTTPHAIFLRWFTVPQFFLFHVALLTLAGHYGLCAIRRRFPTSSVSFLLVFLLYFFGGYFSSKISIGHLINAGFFLWSWALYLAWCLFESSKNEDRSGSWKLVCFVSLLLWVVLMQGSFHIFFHMLLFFSVCLIFSRKAAIYFLSANVLGILLGCYRIIPAYFLDGHAQTIRKVHAGLGGWLPAMGSSHSGLIPEFWISGLVESLAVLRGPRFLNAQVYWEWDAFIGWSGLVLLILGTFHLLRTKKMDWSFSNSHTKMTLTVSVFLVFSVHMFYSLLFQYVLAPIGFPVGERVPSRFIIIPLLFMILVSCYGFDLWLQELNQKMRRWIAAITLFAVTTSLGAHAWLWLASRTTSTYPLDERSGTVFDGLVLDAVLIEKVVEPHYLQILFLGLGISLAGCLVWGGLFFWSRKAQPLGK